MQIQQKVGEFDT